jgi:hypothetical protein
MAYGLAPGIVIKRLGVKQNRPFETSLRLQLWVMGCLRDDAGMMAGLPQIAADLLQRPSRQDSGQDPT